MGFHRDTMSKINITSIIILVIALGHYTLAQYAGARDRVRGNPTRGYSPRKLHPCEESSCYPATGNLLIGRENQLTASSTCGLHGQKRYCIVSHLEERKKCFWCDSRKQTANKPQINHQISNIVYRMLPGTLQKSWWQSENGKENVTIQLDLEAEFHFTHMIIVFKTFRPAAMLIERSYDFGKTWQVYRYFASNCQESFGIKQGYPKNLTDIVCESRYSSVAPSTDGEIIFRVLPPNMHINNPYSQEVQNLLKMTNLRINFTKLHTLGDDLLDTREEIQEKYYYAISDMVVRGSCSCYGHANRCLPLSGIEPKPDMVHGRCECTHNTKGRNCEECEDFFNDLPWRPAIGKQTNACKRCNCNNHATSCHFDAAVYEHTGKVSGGVCDGCKHNTMGPNCEQCKPFFYRDPTRDIQDPEVCRPCDCDPHGALDGGICDSLTDTSNSLEAGACHCKKNVEGRRCDTCKNGFWNFEENNPDGCQPCTCNTQGTIDNQGCDVTSGDCICKRYVTGRDCNQCLPEYWGLSEKRDGCQPCDCDLGGSLDNNCDVITGQCRCREYVQGRTCNQPKQHYFTGSIDFLIYEAESARGSPTCQVVIREPYRDGRENSWTGIGFMRAVEGSFIEFTIDQIVTPLRYDILVRYEPQHSEQWDSVEVRIEQDRNNNFDPYGYCGEYPVNDVNHISLPKGQRSTVALPNICLEPDQVYRVRLDFRRFTERPESVPASVLIDSIVLVPRIEAIPFFNGTALAENRRQEFERYRCSQYLYTVNRNQIPDICKKYHNSIGFYVYNGALSCQCNTTGSVSKLCDDYGGNCHCKPNVVGRRCDRCAPGTYGFGPEGCTACDCNSIGALDNFCNVTTGQCKCRPNTYGRECDQCQPGFWNFPNCQRCECNGHADICESKTGMCINCRNHTEGHNCDRCIDGHYGDPRYGVDIPCRPCPCPGIAGSDHSYADRCFLDAQTRDVICECQEGYAGSRCDVCADNYYGNPEVPGGSCQPCDCSKNVDITRPGNCDPSTGKCLQCLYNTEGDHCEMCKAEYYRLDPDDRCIDCVCNILGTNRTAGPCDRNTGQCHCLKNVIGQECDACADNHWKIASGKGCERCDCDEIGSLAPQCNLYDGQCSCKEHFGGRQCNECQANHWGNPNHQCLACECDPDGAETMQCNRENGSCICRPGIGGYNCDTCARGYIGDAPHCSPCGECFDNWDRILNERHQQTLDIIDKAKKMKTVGAAGGYTREFEITEQQLDEIKDLLSNTSISSEDMQKIEDTQNMLDDTLKQDSDELKDIEEKILNNVTQEINLKQTVLNDLRDKELIVKDITNELKSNATLLQEENVQGALGLIHDARTKAFEAEEQVNSAKKILDDTERQCKSTETRVNRTAKEFQETKEDIDTALETLQITLDEYNAAIPDINNQMCDKRGDPCDSLCGGAGCGFCGGVACEQGATKKADNALFMVKAAEENLRDKELKVDEMLRATTQLKDHVNEAKNLAKKAFEKAMEIDSLMNSSLAERNDKTESMRQFLNIEEYNPNDIIKLVEKTKNMNIKLKPDEIRNLDNKIKNTLASLTNIDVILRDTTPSLDRANSLKKTADEAKENANNILNQAERIIEALNKAENAQNAAKDAIGKVNIDIDTAKKDLIEITSESNTALSKANETASKVDGLQKNLKRLQENVLKNNLFAAEVGKSVKVVEEQAKTSENQARKLKEEYDRVNKTLVEKSSRSYSSRDRANELLQRALKLTLTTNTTLTELQEIQTAHHIHEKNLKMLSDEIDMLNEKLKKDLDVINEKVVNLEVCS